MKTVRTVRSGILHRKNLQTKQRAMTHPRVGTGLGLRSEYRPIRRVRFSIVYRPSSDSVAPDLESKLEAYFNISGASSEIQVTRL
jgi:hypothetical protein